MKLKTPTFVGYVRDEVIGSQNTFHAYTLIAAVALIMAMGFYLNSPNLSFQGVAGSRESNLNFERPVSVKRILVLPGQKVKKGDLLVEVNQIELEMRIREAAAKLAKLSAQRALRDRMNHIVGNREAAGVDKDPLSAEIAALEDEVGFLRLQRNNLYIYADIDGIVGSVNYKVGETVQPYQPIVTISKESPTFVQGFVYERLQTGLSIGSSVTVTSTTNVGTSIEGTVVSLGSRFVEIPARISQAPANAPVWGREVMIEIPPNSQLLLNERVVISPNKSWISSYMPQSRNITKADGGLPRTESTSLQLPSFLSHLPRVN